MCGRRTGAHRSTSRRYATPSTRRRCSTTRRRVVRSASGPGRKRMPRRSCTARDRRASRCPRSPASSDDVRTVVSNAVSLHPVVTKRSRRSSRSSRRSRRASTTAPTRSGRCGPRRRRGRRSRSGSSSRATTATSRRASCRSTSTAPARTSCGATRTSTPPAPLGRPRVRLRPVQLLPPDPRLGEGRSSRPRRRPAGAAAVVRRRHAARRAAERSSAVNGACRFMPRARSAAALVPRAQPAGPRFRGVPGLQPPRRVLRARRLKDTFPHILAGLEREPVPSG